MYVDSCLCLRVQKTKLIVSQAITLNGISHEDAVCSIYSVLVTSPPVVLSAVVNNRLVEAYAAEPETRRLLQEMLAIPPTRDYHSLPSTQTALSTAMVDRRPLNSCWKR